MTADDANKLLAIAKANYSYAFKSMSNQEKVILVKSWAFALQDIPADIVMLAFMQLLSTSKWLPTVAEIREKVKSLYYQTAYTSDFMPEAPEIKHVKEYISSHTNHLRGDGDSYELTLDSILGGSFTVALGSGKMQFTQIGDTRYLDIPETEDEL